MNQLYDSHEHRYVIFFRAYDLFPEILHGIDNLFRNGAPLVEVVARLWNILIWCAIFVEILRGKDRDDVRLKPVLAFVRWLKSFGCARARGGSAKNN